MKPEHLFFAAAAAAMLLVTPMLSRADADPRVADLIKESGAALGIQAVRSVSIVHAKGNLVADGLSGPGDNWNEIGGVRDASTFSTPPLGGGNGWDGSESWNLDQTGLVIVDGGVLGRSLAIDQAYIGDYDLWTPGYGGATVAWGGTKSVEGKSYDVLIATPPKSSVPIEVWFDGATHLPVKAVQTAGPMVWTTTMADFRPVHGLMIPFRVGTSTNAGDSTSFTATSVEMNQADGAAHLAAPSSTPHDFSIANGATQTTVPFQFSENHVYLDVMLNGKGPFHFEFDTGGANVLDTSIAKEIGATGGGTTQVSGVGNASESSSSATINTLQIGDATLRNQVFLLLPMGKSIGVAHGVKIDGFIGYEVLSRFTTTFDYANKEVTFHMPGTYSAPASAKTVPIALNGTQPQFDCAINGLPTTCTLDTGARNALSLYTPFVAANPGVVPAKLTALGTDAYGVGGSNKGRLGRLKSFSVAGFALHDLVADYPQTKGGLAMPFLGANVGGAVWKRFTMTLDYRQLTMTLTPNGAFDSRDDWDRSGLYLINNGAITIVDVRPGTPAAKAGLTKGEVITSIDGDSSLSLSDVRDLFLRPPGTVEHFVVKSKDGTTRNVTLTLEDYV